MHVFKLDFAKGDSLEGEMRGAFAEKVYKGSFRFVTELPEAPDFCNKRAH